MKTNFCVFIFTALIFGIFGSQTYAGIDTTPGSKTVSGQAVPNRQVPTPKEIKHPSWICLKTSSQIKCLPFRNYSTFLQKGGETGQQELGRFVSIFDHIREGGQDTLVGCGNSGIWSTTTGASGRSAAEIVSACTGEIIDFFSEGPTNRTGRRTPRGGNSRAINTAVSRMDSMIGKCIESSNETVAYSWVAPFIRDLAMFVGLAVDIYTAYHAVNDIETNPGTDEITSHNSTSSTDPHMITSNEQYTSGPTTTTITTTRSYSSTPGGALTYTGATITVRTQTTTPHPDGYTTVKVVITTTYDAQGNVVSQATAQATYQYDSNGNLIKVTTDPPPPPQPPPPAPEPTPPAPEPTPPPAPEGGGGGSGSNPMGECNFEGCTSTCKKMADWWNKFKSECGEKNWGTYDCQSFLAGLLGCPDPSLVMPGPDGEMRCGQIMDTETMAAAKEKTCKRLQGVMQPSGDGQKMTCKVVMDKGSRGSRNICTDPRAINTEDKCILNFEWEIRKQPPPRPKLPDPNPPIPLLKPTTRNK